MILDLHHKLTTSAEDDTFDKQHAIKQRTNEVRKALYLRPVKWYCPNTGDSLSYPVDEPMNKPCYCTSCNKTHLFIAGEMNEEDNRILHELKILTEIEEEDWPSDG